MRRYIFSFIMLVSFTSITYAAPILPWQVGQVLTYEFSPIDGGDPWIENWAIEDIVTIGSEEYFRISGGSLLRSTEDEIYEFDSEVGESLFFQYAPVGTTWSHGTNNTVVILDDSFLVEDAYGGPYYAYQLGFIDPHGPWAMYIVPEVGIVRMDTFDEEPHNIARLINVTSVPESSSIILFVFSLLALAFNVRRFQC
jgi:hypothetical protein